MKKKLMNLAAIVLLAVFAFGCASAPPERPPANFRAVAQPEGNIRLTWDRVPGAQEYVIHVSTSETGQYRQINAGRETAYTYVTSQANTQFFFKIEAKNRQGSSELSAVISARTPTQAEITAARDARLAREAAERAAQQAERERQEAAARAAEERERQEAIAQRTLVANRWTEQTVTGASVLRPDWREFFIPNAVRGTTYHIFVDGNLLLARTRNGPTEQIWSTSSGAITASESGTLSFWLVTPNNSTYAVAFSTTRTRPPGR